MNEIWKNKVAVIPLEHLSLTCMSSYFNVDDRGVSLWLWCYLSSPSWVRVQSIDKWFSVTCNVCFSTFLMGQQPYKFLPIPPPSFHYLWDILRAQSLATSNQLGKTVSSNLDPRKLIKATTKASITSWANQAPIFLLASTTLFHAKLLTNPTCIVF